MKKYGFPLREINLLIASINPAGIYLLKVSKWNTRTMSEICSKLTIKIPERRIYNFEYISHLVLVFHLLTLPAGKVSVVKSVTNSRCVHQLVAQVNTSTYYICFKWLCRFWIIVSDQHNRPHITDQHNRLWRIERENHATLDVQEVMELGVVENIWLVLNSM